MTPGRRAGVADGIARAGGIALATATRALGAVRPAAKPLHPRGDVRRGSLTRHGLADPTGCRWLDEPGSDTVVARASRAAGLPAPLPDVHGLALQLHVDGVRGDLLFATTGRGRLTRYVLVPRLGPAAPMTTLLPYRTPSGAVVLGLLPLDDDGDDDRWRLVVARPRGRWRNVGHLALLDDVTLPDLSFDPVRHQLPQLDQYAFVTRLREPAYASARRSRD